MARIGVVKFSGSLLKFFGAFLNNDTC